MIQDGFLCHLSSRGIVEIIHRAKGIICYAGPGVQRESGDHRRQADAPLVAELRRSALSLSYDEEPMPDMNPEALDFRVASGLFAGLRTWGNSAAETLNLLMRHQGRLVPTVGGVLLFGTDRERHFPDAWIQCGRFRGANKAAILDQQDVRDHLPLALEQAFDFVKKHALQSAEFGELRRKDVWNVPLEAVREALANAIVHADYSQIGAPIRVAIFDDRIEIENPGLLVPGMIIADVRQGVSRIRNRVIGRVFKELNLIEHWGSGFQRMAAACQAMHLPEPVFEEIAFRFRVTFRLSRVAISDDGDATDQKILAMIRAGETTGGVSPQTLSQMIGISSRAIRQRLTRLSKTGKIVAVGKSAYDPNKRYLPVQKGSA